MGNDLHDGAKAIKPIRMKLGCWVEMEYDAVLTFHGIDWYRTSMSDNGDRSDWVADLPEVSVSVHDYHWRGEEFGPRYASFKEALIGQLKRAYANYQWKLKESREKLAKTQQSLIVIEQANRSLPENAGKPINGNWR